MSTLIYLNEIADRLRKGESPSTTVRAFLGTFGAQRRGYAIVQRIRGRLRRTGLKTIPDFESAYLEALITFALVDQSPAKKLTQSSAVSTESPANLILLAAESQSSSIYADPTYRISKLAAANNPPVSTTPDSLLQEAATMMLSLDFSQVPVVCGERNVKGMLSWTSIGARLAFGKNGTHVRDMMDPHHEINADASLFQAIPLIVQYQYVLIRGSDNKIAGIVTASDLSLQFQQLAEPFLLLSEIESDIRRILDGKFDAKELSAVSDSTNTQRALNSVADLTFGDYVRLLESPDGWKKVNLPLDRKTFVDQLDTVREIRNDVMHFDPDGVTPGDLERLRDFARFLQRLRGIGAS